MMRARSILTMLTTGLFLATSIVVAQDSASIQECNSIEGFHRLDFWLGEWRVESGDEIIGANRIFKVQNGCAIEEHWTDAGGVKQKKLIELFEDGGVRFQGIITKADDTTYLDRTTLGPLSDGTVSQHIQLSSDGGDSWSDGWLGIYNRTDSTDHRESK